MVSYFNVKTTVTVDEVGRMVLPKPVREAIGISGRTNVTIEIVSGTAQIAVIDRRNGPVTRRRGRTVYAGPLPPEWDSGEAISRMRERRNRQRSISSIPLSWWRLVLLRAGTSPQQTCW